MDRKNPRPRALVLGAGMSGLAAARSLAREGYEVRVLEATNRPGGCFHTACRDGFVVELGPNTIQASQELQQLCADAGCGENLQTTENAASRRYLVHRGRLLSLPSKPQGLLSTPLLSLGAKARLAMEPWRGDGPGPTESVGAFFRRRMGSAAAASFGDAMVQGIYAGDPEELTIGAAFPRILALEQAHGSLLKGLKASKDQPQKTLVTYRGGLQALAQRLAEGLDLRLGCPVIALRHDFSGFTAWVEGGAVHTAERLVVALPRAPSLRLLSELDPAFAAPPLPHAPVAVVALGYSRDNVAHPLDGFGFLAPHKEGRRILGCIFSSTLFPDRAPEGTVLLTAMVGGRRRQDLIDLDDKALAHLVRNELSDLLGTRGEPLLQIIHRWQPGIPQPSAAWTATQNHVEELVSRVPDLTVVGNWLRGVSVPDCVKAGWAVKGR